LAEVGLHDDGGRHLNPYLRFLLRRVAVGVVLAVLVSLLIFAATELLPGDAAQAILGKTATPEAVEVLRAQLGLDRPAVQRYLEWLAGIVQGDLGNSLSTRGPVTEAISGRVANSLILAGITSMIMIPVSLLLGAYAGTRPGRPGDLVVSGTSLAFIAVPEFVIATFLILLLAIGTDLLPPVSLVAPGTSPLATPLVLVLPVLTLLLASIAQNVRMVRAGVVDTMAAPYVQMARLNGLPEREVVLRHGLRNALPPAVQVIALNLQWLIGGIVIVEFVFQDPGVGQLLTQAVALRDIPLVQALAVLIAVLYIAVNIATDLVVVLLVPKLRTAGVQ
jgi:peptide/nickel transport system permease protein